MDADVVRPIGALLNKLYDAFVAEEAMLVEVNPLIVTSDRQVAALDAKVRWTTTACSATPTMRRCATSPRRTSRSGWRASAA